MKTIRHILLTLWCLAYMAFAAEVTLAWNTPPTAEFVTSWRVWSAGQVIATAAVPQAALTIPATATVTPTP